MADGATITWLGHAAVKIETGNGGVILVDPWIYTNPVTPESQKQLDRVDVMLISHGHGDNLGDAVRIAKEKQPLVIAMNEVCGYLTSKGAERCSGGNTGGSQEWEGIRVTMVNAIHSSSIENDGSILYAGLAVGFVIRLADNFTIYHAGDTAVFEGMELIGRLHKPDVAILPIGDYYTMGPAGAAEAIRLLGVKNVIPVHYGTFPVLTGTPEQLRHETANILGLKILAIQPGESVRQNEIN